MERFLYLKKKPNAIINASQIFVHSTIKCDMHPFIQRRPYLKGLPLPSWILQYAESSNGNKSKQHLRLFFSETKVNKEEEKEKEEETIRPDAGDLSPFHRNHTGVKKMFLIPPP